MPASGTLLSFTTTVTVASGVNPLNWNPFVSTATVRLAGAGCAEAKGMPGALREAASATASAALKVRESAPASPCRVREAPIPDRAAMNVDMVGLLRRRGCPRGRQKADARNPLLC